MPKIDCCRAVKCVFNDNEEMVCRLSQCLTITEEGKCCRYVEKGEE